MSEDPKITYGVWISRETRMGCEYVVARVMKREDDARHPLNATERYGMPEAIFVENLSLEGYVSEYGVNAFHLFDPSYRNMHSVDLGEAKRMAKTLQRIRARIERDHAIESGDVLLAFCKAIGARWAVTEVENRGTRLQDSLWCFWSLEEGRNVWRSKVEEARTAQAVRTEARAG